MDNDQTVNTMASLGLDYNPAINSTKAFEARISSLNKQLTEMKLLAMQGAKDINNTFSSQLGSLAGSKTIVDQYGTPIKTIQTQMAQMGTASTKSYTTATKAAKEHSQSVKQVAKDYNVLGSEWNRRAGWFISGTMFYGAIKGAKEAVQTISEVEMGMVEISRVMEDSSFVFKDYRDELLQFGVDYGQSFETVQDIALRWAQAGYGVKDSLDNTKYSLLALNTAELDAKNATESLIGIMSQWQMTSTDMPLLLDKINKTADDFTVTSQDLVDGLLRSSGAARIMNMSIDETISLLTVMREASGRTGKEVGSALNSIISYIQRPGSIKVLESLGINMFADEAKTQFRNVMEVFQDVGSKWGTASDVIKDGFVESADEAGLFSEELATALGLQGEWNDLQQRDLAQASAGVYRRNYYIGMIERLSTAQDVLNNMTDAAGYSQAENANTMDTLEKKYQSLKTSAQQLAVALGDAGLLNALKGLTDTAINLSNGFTEMDDNARTLLITALELLAAVKGIQAVGGMITSKKLLFGSAESAALLPGWSKLLVIIPAVIGAITLYANNSKNASDATNGLREKQEKLTESYTDGLKAAEETEKSMLEQAVTAETLANKLEELNAKEVLNGSEKAQLKDITERLNTSFSGLGLEIDINTGKVIGNTSAIHDNIAALKTQAKEQAYQAKAQATANAYVEQEMLLGKTRNEIDIAQGDIDSLNGKNSQAYIDANAEIEEAKKRAAMQGKPERGLTNEINEIKKKYGITDNIVDINENYQKKNSLSILATEQEKRLSELDAELNDWVNKASEVNSSEYIPTATPILSKDEDTKTSGSYSNSALENALKALEYKKHLNEISIEDEIATLNQIKANHINTSDELMDINKRIYDAEKSLMDEKLKAKEDMLNISKDWISEETQYGKLSSQELLDAYNRIRDKQISNIDAVKYATKGLFDTYKDLISEQQDLIKDAYDERMNMIDEEADAEKEKLEDRKKALQDELDKLDKKDSERSYEQKMSDLYKDLAYWQVRTSEEARKKVVDLEAEIDEEKYKNQLGQQKDSINDKMDAIDNEIDEVEKAAKKEKEKWEKSYKLTEKAFDEHSTNIVALASAMSKEAYKEWETNYLTPLKTALASGDFSDFDSAMNNLNDSIIDSNMGSKSNYVLANKDGTSSAGAGDIVVTGGGLYRKNSDGTSTRVGDLSGGNTSDYNKVIDEYNKLLPKAHDGGETLSYGSVYMKPGELIFPPDLSLKMDGLINFLKGNPVYQSNSTVSKNDNRKEIKINNLVNIEKNTMEDDVDSNMFAKELNRLIKVL